jgi:hypothetical protein
MERKMMSDHNLLEVLDGLSRYLPILKKEGLGYVEYTIDLGVKVISLGKFNLKNPQMSLQRENFWIGLWMRIIESTNYDIELYTTKEAKSRYYWIRLIQTEVEPNFVVEESYPVRQLYYALPDILLKAYEYNKKRGELDGTVTMDDSIV